MKILLTGHKGYIGAVAVPMLRSAGHEVAGFDTDLFEGCEFGDGLENVTEIRKDIRDLRASDLNGFDAVIHLAALSNDPLGNLDSNLTYDVNHKASVHLAEFAKQAGVKRFVFSSSAALSRDLCGPCCLYLSDARGTEEGRPARTPGPPHSSSAGPLR